MCDCKIWGGLDLTDTFFFSKEVMVFMNDWKPITDSEFSELFTFQYAELTEDHRNAFERVRVPFSSYSQRQNLLECLFDFLR
jgi:hypothetical protein